MCDKKLFYSGIFKYLAKGFSKSAVSVLAETQPKPTESTISGELFFMTAYVLI